LDSIKKGEFQREINGLGWIAEEMFSSKEDEY
jgi:hypothetical protein